MSHTALRRSTRRRALPRLRAEGDDLRHLLRTRAGRSLAGAVGAIAALTVIGLLALWPYGWHPTAERTSLTVPADVRRVVDAPCAGDPGVACRTITVAVEGHEVK